jgi:hypothetical protein
MNALTITVRQSNGSTYKGITIKGNVNTWEILKVSGKFNYVSVYKRNLPFVSLGKQFNNFEEMKAAYKSKEVLQIIEIAETMLNQAGEIAPRLDAVTYATRRTN